MFVTVPGKKIKDSSYEIEDVFNVVGGNNPKNVYFCRASSPVRDIDYRGLLEAMVELSYNTEFEEVEEVDKQMEQAQQTGKYRNPFSLTVLESKNLIFRGAPGTGKSYLAKKIAADIISNGKVDKYEDLPEEQKKQVEFVQFHPSYDYSDFVEGLRPKLNDDVTMGFELRDGIFKEFVARARKNYEDSKKPQETVEDDGSTSDEKTEPKRKDPKKFVFIIDEINRGEISKIFGELFFAIDPSYRGEKGSISTQYSNLHSDPSDKFYIPENVYIIGTMNDIDRSVDSFDFAMRRRFRFVELKANEQTDMLTSLGDKATEAKARMIALNNAIAATEDLNENYQIGPAYFLKLEDIGFDQLWTDHLQPLLQDYVQGMYDENGIMARFESAYNSPKPDTASGQESDRGEVQESAGETDQKSTQETDKKSEEESREDSEQVSDTDSTQKSTSENSQETTPDHDQATTQKSDGESDQEPNQNPDQEPNQESTQGEMNGTAQD